MFEKSQVLVVASALANHAAQRQFGIAQNVANADTPGYRSIDIEDFSQAFQAAKGSVLRQTRAGHVDQAPMPGLIFQSGINTGQGLSPNGNSVSLEAEMVKAAETRKEHDMALAVYKKSLDILRASLGRR